MVSNEIKPMSVFLSFWKKRRRAQFLMWTNLDHKRISLFTADVKEDLHPECGVLVTTYHMVRLKIGLWRGLEF